MLVIDFEATTPAGHRPQPVEVAALAVQHVPGYGPQPTGWIYESLIRPPDFAPVTSMMTRTTGIRPEDVASARTVDQVLAELDTAAPAGPLLLVAQHAPVEASLLFDHRDHCPRLAATALLDTRLLAKALRPQLPSFGLDALIAAFNLPRPADRHRALADCTVTALPAAAADRRCPVRPVHQSRGRDGGGRLPGAGRTSRTDGVVLKTRFRKESASATCAWAGRPAGAGTLPGAAATGRSCPGSSSSRP